VSADDQPPAAPDYALDPSRPLPGQEALLRLMGGVTLGAETGLIDDWSRPWQNKWGVYEDMRTTFRQMMGQFSQTPSPTERLEIPDLKADPKLREADFDAMRCQGWSVVNGPALWLPLDAPTVSTPLVDLEALERRSTDWSDAFRVTMSEATAAMMRRAMTLAEERRLRQLADYRLATGPLAPFLRAVLADPGDPIPRMLLGEFMAEGGLDPPVWRSPQGADLTASDSLQAAAGRWSVREGVLCWHGKGLPLARVARLRLDEADQTCLGERVEFADATVCQRCGTFSGRIDYGPCSCRGLVAPPPHDGGVSAGPTCSCPPGRPEPRWLCRTCRSQKAIDRLYARQFAAAGPERLARLRAEYQREGDLRNEDWVEEALGRAIGHTEPTTE
jgi:hypothetical protein